MSEKIQIIEKDGRPEWAVLPYDEYERLRTTAEVTDDVRAFDNAKAEMEGQATIPSEVVNRLLDGDNPVRVYREHLGLKQNQLANLVGVTKGYLSHVETGKKEGTVDLYRKLARTLEVSIDELVGWRE